MKKPIIILVSALVLATGSMGAFLAVKHKKDTETSIAEEEKRDNLLFNFNADNITKMEFDLKDANYIIERNEDETWEMKSGGEFKVDDTYLQLVRTYLSDLTAETNFGKIDDEKKAMYGLDDPVTIKLYDDNDTYEISIGDKSPTGDYYYAMTPSKDKVFGIESYKGTSLIADRLILKTKDLIPYENDEIDTITIKNKNGDDFVLSYNSSNQIWGLEKKYDLLDTDPTAISSMVNELVRLEADEMLDENFEDRKGLGLDDPDAQVIVKGIDGKEHSFLVKAMKDDANYSYVLKEDDNQLCLYSSSNISLASTTVFDYTTQKISGADMFTIDSFSIKTGSHSDEFTINVKDKTCKMSGKDLDINNSEGYMLFQNFYNSFSQIPMAGIDMDVKPKLEDPVLTVKYELTEGGNTSIDVTDGGNGIYYIFKDGKYTGAYADEERFKGRTSVEEFYLKLIAYSIKKQ